MPRAAPKRNWDELANKSDPEDEDYDDHIPQVKKNTGSKTKSKKRPPKRRKQPGDSDDDLSDDIFDDSSEIGGDYEEDEDPNVERNARGSVRRQAAKNAKFQISSSSSELDELEEESDEGELEAPTPKRGKAQRLVLKLPKVPLAPKSQPEPPTPRTTRSTRARSAGIKDVVPKLTAGLGNRRVTRRNRDGSEDIVALSGSGRHVEMIRRGTRSPEPVTRARKTVPTALTTDVVAEEPEGDVQDTKEESKAEPEPERVEGTQFEIMESDLQGDFEDELLAVVASDNSQPSPSKSKPQEDQEMADSGFVPESEHGEEEDDDDEDEDEDEAPRSGKRSRPSRKQPDATEEQEQSGEQEEEKQESRPLRRSARKSAAKAPRKKQDDGSDFEPGEDEEVDDDLSESERSRGSPRKRSQNLDEEEDSSTGRRSRLRKRNNSQVAAESEAEADELAEELAELKRSRPRRRLEPEIVYEKPRRTRKSVDYRIIRPELAQPIEEAENEVTESPSRRPRGGGGGWQRSLLSTYGPFGGGGPPPLLGGPHPLGAIGGVESDSSDDEAVQRAKPGTLPTAAGPSAFGNAANLGVPAQPHNNDAVQGASGTPANLGKIKDRQALADADPLGVDPNVNFDSVGGMQGHIDQLKEMVSLPLLYPEIFQRLRIVPPRGVLFHGPPGTGKTLLARALATSVSTEGKKVTFYMRKGADALSKWVGEAERQLRLLFEEARKNQPSIIFFDEIDGEYDCSLI